MREIAPHKNREAVLQQSPTLPRSGYVGDDRNDSAQPGQGCDT